MAQTPTDVFNLALGILGRPNVEDYLEASVEANTLRTYYDNVRRGELQKSLWRFAMARVELGRNATAPAFGWSYAYDLPSLFIRIAEISERVDLDPPFEDDQYNIEGTQVLCDVEQVYLRYVWDQTDINKWDPLFKQAVSAQLAMWAAEDLTASDTAMERANVFYSQAMKSARSINAIQKARPIQNPGSWVNNRFS